MSRPKYELTVSPHEPKEVARVLGVAYRENRLGWVFDQLASLSPFQAAIVTQHLLSEFQAAGFEPSGFLTLLTARAKHDPLPRRARVVVST